VRSEEARLEEAVGLARAINLDIADSRVVRLTRRVSGTLLGSGTVTELGEALFEEIRAVASGRPTKSEELGFGDEEFVPWQLGAVM